MSRSVLVIDTPENCYSCYLRKLIRDLPYCAKKLERIKDSMVRPDWCPLKPLPEKSNIEEDMTDYQCGLIDGRNQCIDEITREKRCMAINTNKTVKKCNVCGKWKTTAYEPDYPMLNNSRFSRPKEFFICEECAKSAKKKDIFLRGEVNGEINRGGLW